MLEKHESEPGAGLGRWDRLSGAQHRPRLPARKERQREITTVSLFVAYPVSGNCRMRAVVRQTRSVPNT